jgi:predicted PhzF superfamily epimerase YddE/YHI9
MLADAEAVLTVRPDPQLLQGLKLGVIGKPPEHHDCLLEVRAFVVVNSSSFYEDPVTGSLNASVGQWLIGSGVAPKQYVASQGHKRGRQGRVYIDQDDDGQVWVGGGVVDCFQGDVWL